MSEATGRLLQYYDKTGIVDFRQSHNFIPVDSFKNINLHGGPVINDCMYRNMYRFRKMLVLDFDEFFIPQNQMNLSAMLTEVETTQALKPHAARSYTFRNVFMFADFVSDDSEELITLRHRMQVEPSLKGWWTKSIIDPQACINMHNHNCRGFTPLYNTEDHYPNVSSDIAVKFHYKKCSSSAVKNQCEKIMETKNKNDAALKFKEQLECQTKVRFKELNMI